MLHVLPGTPDPPDLRPAAGLRDCDVIRRSQAEPEIFALLFERHAAGIGRYAARRLGPDPAQDVVAETFLTAFRSRERYDLRRQDALPWLHGIAANLIRRHYRDEERRLRAAERVRVDPVLSPVVSPPDQVDARLIAAETDSAVARALASLTGEQRDVVLLVTWAGLTHDQVAAALGLPEGTVRSRMARARARLRAELSGLRHDDLTDRSQ
ncbi:MAG: RNA polymerase sigma factor [Streptosporangiaceae bacterium]